MFSDKADRKRSAFYLYFMIDKCPRSVYNIFIKHKDMDEYVV